MNKDQVAEINMFQTTELILAAPANKPITVGLPAFVSAYEAARKVIRTGARTEPKPGNTPK